MVTTTNNQMSGQNSSDNAASSGAAQTSREKKKKGLSLSSLKSPFKFLGKTYCKGCHKKCSGEGNVNIMCKVGMIKICASTQRN